HVVELGGRFPRLQGEARPREQFAHAAAGHVCRKDVRLAPVGQPMVPEAAFAALGQVDLDLGLLALLLALGLCFLGSEIRPNPGDEGNTLAVAKPAQARRAAGDRSEPPRFAAVW